MGPYDNEHQRYVYSPELMDGHWYEDDYGQLYIIPAADVVMEAEGPDNPTADTLVTLSHPLSRAQLEQYQLTPILSYLRRWNPFDGYYHA